MAKHSMAIVVKNNNTDVTAKNAELLESVRDVWAKVRKKLTPKTARIVNDLEKEVTEVRNTKLVYQMELSDMEKELRALQLTQDIKDTRSELKRLSALEKNMETALITTLNNELYDVPGKTLIQKVQHIRENG